MAGALLHQDPVVTCLHETTAVGARAAVAPVVAARATEALAAEARAAEAHAVVARGAVARTVSAAAVALVLIDRSFRFEVHLDDFVVCKSV